MSQTDATLLAGSFGVFGVLAGLFIERLLRSFGRLWCEQSDWRMAFFDDPRKLGSGNEVEPSKARAVEYSFSVDLFNGREVPDGLRGIHLEFTCDGGRVIDRRLLDIQPRPGRFMGAMRVGDLTPPPLAVLSVVNLPPRQWVSKELRGSNRNPEDARLLAKCQKVELVGQRHRWGLIEGKTYRKTIATSTEPRSWWRRWFGFE